MQEKSFLRYLLTVWFNYAGRCRSALRSWGNPSDAEMVLGFRLCKRFSEK